MVTESVIDSTVDADVSTDVLASGALAADLAADRDDLLDVSATLGVEFRRVVAELLRAPLRPAPSVVRALAAIAPDPRAAPPHGDPLPFVWVRLVPARRRPRVSVRAGWLVPAAVRLIADEARASGPDTEVQIIVPLDSGDGAVARIRALCNSVAPGMRLTIDVQRERPTQRPARARRGRSRLSGWESRDTHSSTPRFRAGTWIVFGPLGTTS